MWNGILLAETFLDPWFIFNSQVTVLGHPWELGCPGCFQVQESNPRVVQQKPARLTGLFCKHKLVGRRRRRVHRSSAEQKGGEVILGRYCNSTDLQRSPKWWKLNQGKSSQLFKWLLTSGSGGIPNVHLLVLSCGGLSSVGSWPLTLGGSSLGWCGGAPVKSASVNHPSLAIF